MLSTMLKPPSRFSDDLVAATALLRTQGLSTRDIEPVLRRIVPSEPMSRSTVSRMLQQAELDQYFKPHPTIDFTRLPESVHRAALDLLVPLEIDDVVKQVAPPGHTCHVSVLREDAVSAESVRAFGLMAAQVLAVHLMQTRKLGVAWGRLVNALVDGLAQVLQTPPCGPGAKFGSVGLFPVVGEPMHVATTMHEFSSTVLAMRLAETLNREKIKVPSLAGVPAYLPGNGTKQVRAVLRKFFGRVPGYAGFGGKGGLFASLDTIVTGAGVPGKGAGGPHGVFLSERVIAEGTNFDTMPALVYGDLAGVLIPKQGLSAADVARVASMNEGWTGLRLKDIQRCAKAANARGGGGMIVVVNGANKAPLVHEIVRQGLVNHMVIDVGLAKAFSELARAKAGR